MTHKPSQYQSVKTEPLLEEQLTCNDDIQATCETIALNGIKEEPLLEPLPLPYRKILYEIIHVDETPTQRPEDATEPPREEVKTEPQLVVGRGHKWFDLKKMEVQMKRGKRHRRKITLHHHFIVITPINLINPTTEPSVAAKNDYLHEEIKFRRGNDEALWDDVHGNLARVGDLFAFSHRQKRHKRDLADVFIVVGKLTSEKRPSHWLIQEKENRKVLRLSKYAGYTSATKLRLATGMNNIQCNNIEHIFATVRVKLKKKLQLKLEYVDMHDKLIDLQRIVNLSLGSSQ